MKEKLKIIKSECDYVKSSVDGWVKFKDPYNYDMVIKTLDGLKDKIQKFRDENFPDKKTS